MQVIQTLMNLLQPLVSSPWVKRCVNICCLCGTRWMQSPDKNFGIAAGDIWMTKIHYDNKLNRICGMCVSKFSFSLLAPAFFNMSTSEHAKSNLVRSIRVGMSELCELHGKTELANRRIPLLKLIDKLTRRSWIGKPPTAVQSKLPRIW